MGILQNVKGRFGKRGAAPSELPAAARPRRDELALPGPTRYSLVMLRALQGKAVYQGTVPAHVTKRRRAKNKVARKTRRLSRVRAQ